MQKEIEGKEWRGGEEGRDRASRVDKASMVDKASKKRGEEGNTDHMGPERYENTWG